MEKFGKAGRVTRLVLDKAPAPGKDIKQSAQCSGVSRRAPQHLTAHLLGVGLGCRGLIHFLLASLHPFVRENGSGTGQRHHCKGYCHSINSNIFSIFEVANAQIDCMHPLWIKMILPDEPNMISWRMAEATYPCVTALQLLSTPAGRRDRGMGPQRLSTFSENSKQ